MRWMSLMVTMLFLSGCIYTEGSVIYEPEDIDIPPQTYHHPALYPCQSHDVSKARDIKVLKKYRHC